RGMIGPVDPLDAPGELAGLNALAPDRSRARDTSGHEAEAAAGARRIRQCARPGPRYDHGGVDLPLVAVKVDLGARHVGNERAGPGGDGAPDQPVDQPVL